MNDQIVAYFKYKELRYASARKWWENKPTEELWKEKNPAFAKFVERFSEE